MAGIRDKKNRFLEGVPYLYRHKRDGFLLQLINGKRVALGRDRMKAIAIAKEYNKVARSLDFSIDKLLDLSGINLNEQQPKLPSLSAHIDLLKERMLTEKNMVQATKDALCMDLERAKQFFTMPANEITLKTVNEYLQQFHAGTSANVQNRKVSFLEKLFSFAMDESLMTTNPASLKRRKPVAQKARKRLNYEAYQAIHAIAPLWLQTAMDLSLQTTHARLEITRIQYQIKEPQAGVCGVVWNKNKALINGLYGTLYIHRQKVKEKEAAFVAIPVGEAIKEIIDRSRDRANCPYVVHRVPKGRSNPMSKEVTHKFQLAPNYLSRAFTTYRDKTGLFDHLEPEQRPTFHEIRALSAKMFQDLGIDPQSRMAHTDAKSTQVYTRNHRDWVAVPHAEICL